jgi:hypothetical protein
MLKNKNTRRQMMFVAMSMMAVFVVGQIAGRMPARIAVEEWELFEFTHTELPHGVDFIIEQEVGVIRGVLTNTGEENFGVGAEFALVKQVCAETDLWRRFPFADDVVFHATEMALSSGYRTIFSITEEMLATPLLPGEYKIVTTINMGDVDFRQVRALFSLSQI